MFRDPRGQQYFEGEWKTPEVPRHPIATLLRANLGLGANPDGWTAHAPWEREKDLPDDVYFRASGAM